MNIPLDYLYHWVQGIIPVPVVIYRFYPHGSKNIFDLTLLTPLIGEHYVDIPVVAHDQEPLNYNLYTNIDLALLQQLWQTMALSNPVATEIRCQALVDKNLLAIPLASGSLHDQAILLHS